MKMKSYAYRVPPFPVDECRFCDATTHLSDRKNYEFGQEVTYKICEGCKIKRPQGDFTKEPKPKKK